MKHNVNCRFTFQNVGQGLFYTGMIDSFNFVYDCGSENDVFRDLALSSYARGLNPRWVRVQFP